MNSKITKLFLAGFLAVICFTNIKTRAEAVKVELVKSGSNWQLMRDGKPFFIKGAGITAGSPLEKLKQAGGNSVRIWGTELAPSVLDEAQKLGLTVTVGIWMHHENDTEKFSYDNEKMVKDQQELVRQQILKYKDHPAVLLWGIGNEMEGYKAGNKPEIWKAVNDAAKLAKELDPNHPTMTVFAEVGGERVACVHKYCPDIDIVGLNTYAGASSIGERYAKLNGTKPYIITEFGPPGAWETAKTAWGVPVEPGSTSKADSYLKSYHGSIEQKPLCLGSYAFLWGSKQETTATWYGMFLKDGTKLQAVDVISELWTGKPAADPCPVINQLKINGPDTIAPETTFSANLDASDPGKQPLQVRWVVQPEQDKRSSGGAEEPVLPELTAAIVKGDNTQVEVRAPQKPGGYRLFVYVRNGAGAAVANVPFKVEYTKP